MALTMYMNGHGYDAHLGADLTSQIQAAGRAGSAASFTTAVRAAPPLGYSQAVKDLQVLLKAVAAATGKENFGVVTPDGLVGPSTTFALLNIVKAGAARIPVLDDLIAGIMNMPFAGQVIDAIASSRGFFVRAMQGAEIAWPTEIQNIYRFIQAKAEAIAVPLKALAAMAPKPPTASPPINPRFVRQLKTETAWQPYVSKPHTDVQAESGAARFFKSPLMWAILGGAAVIGTAAYIVLRK